MKKLLAGAPVVLLWACSTVPQQQATLRTHIADELRAASVPARPREAQAVPAAVSSSLLPPLLPPVAKMAPGQSQHRFDLSVTDGPVSQVMMAIVADTPYSILVSPRSTQTVMVAAQGAGATPVAVQASPRAPETITINLKNVTVFEALDAIREQYGYEYSVDGNRIYVQPPEMRTKLYHVNYVVGQRRGVSDLQVIAGASPTSGGGGGGGAGGGGGGGAAGGGASGGSSSGGSYASVQASGLSSVSKSDVWGEIEDAVRTTLGCVIPGNTPMRGGAGGGGAAGSSGGSAGRADVSFVGDRETGARFNGGSGCADGRAFVINQVSGTALVRGMPKELRQIEAILRSMQVNIERQVIIEAKIIDVELNEGSQQGINWSALGRGGHRASLGANTDVIVDGTGASRRAIGFPSGTTVSAPALSDLLGDGLIGTTLNNAFSSGVGIALQATNFSALINFLESQGHVQVLSSPRIATLNNQKAVLKVGSEEPFVTNISGGTTSVSATTGTVSSPPTLTYQPFFSGISLDVTPQIDENDNITLHVHSLVNSITEREKIALPTSSIRVPFAVNSVSETDSVVRTRDGQVIVIGGLMSESSSDNRARLPIAGDIPLLGAAFGKTDRGSRKRELVILLKPTVVKGDDSWAANISATQARVQQLTPAAPRLPGQ